MKKKEIAAIINEVLGKYAIKGKKYHSRLPKDLIKWYVYTQNQGHAIIAIAEEKYQKGTDFKHFLTPIPVKSVIKNFSIQDGLVIVSGIHYEHLFGAVVSDDDYEFDGMI